MSRVCVWRVYELQLSENGELGALASSLASGFYRKFRCLFSLLFAEEGGGWGRLFEFNEVSRFRASALYNCRREKQNALLVVWFPFHFYTREKYIERELQSVSCVFCGSCEVSQKNCKV